MRSVEAPDAPPAIGLIPVTDAGSATRDRGECRRSAILRDRRARPPPDDSMYTDVSLRASPGRRIVSYESHAEPIKLGYLFDFVLPDGYPEAQRLDLTRRSSWCSSGD